MTSCRLKYCEFNGNALTPNPCDTCHIKEIDCRHVTSYVTSTVKWAICSSRTSGFYAKPVDEAICARCKDRESGELTLEEEISVVAHLARDHYFRAGTCEFVGLMAGKKAEMDKDNFIRIRAASILKEVE